MSIEECNKCLGNDDNGCKNCPHYADTCDGKEDEKIIEGLEVRNCPICGKEMEEKDELKSQNKFWVCRDCIISVDILYAIRDPK